MLDIHNTVSFINTSVYISKGFPGGSGGKESACNAGDPDLGGEDPLEKGMVTHSSILAWRIPWTEPDGLQSMGLQRVRHDWALNNNKYISKAKLSAWWASFLQASCKHLHIPHLVHQLRFCCILFLCKCVFHWTIWQKPADVLIPYL